MGQEHPINRSPSGLIGSAPSLLLNGFILSPSPHWIVCISTSIWWVEAPCLGCGGSVYSISHDAEHSCHYLKRFLTPDLVKKPRFNIRFYTAKYAILCTPFSQHGPHVYTAWGKLPAWASTPIYPPGPTHTLEAYWVSFWCKCNGFVVPEGGLG